MGRNRADSNFLRTLFPELAPPPPRKLLFQMFGRVQVIFPDSLL